MRGSGGRSIAEQKSYFAATGVPWAHTRPEEVTSCGTGAQGRVAVSRKIWGKLLSTQPYAPTSYAATQHELIIRKTVKSQSTGTGV